jgi:outer membrane protein assembly factor BamB
VTLDVDIRSLERDARARRDDPALQLALARSLERLGRGREALEAYIRAAAGSPADPDVERALGAVEWWCGPRASAGGTRSVRVTPLVDAGARVRWTRPVGAAGLGLAIDRARVYARAVDRAGRARLVALALHDGRVLWESDDDRVDENGAAPPLAVEGAVHDAVLVREATSVVLRVRSRDGATGRTRWTLEQELASTQPGAGFDGALCTGSRIVLAVGPRGRLAFDPLVRVIDAATGTTVDGFAVRGLSDLAADATHLYIAAAFDRNDRRVEARRFADGSRAWAAVRGARTHRVLAAADGTVVAALEDGLVFLDPSGMQRSRLNLRLSSEEALVAISRVLVGAWSRREGVVALDLGTGNRFWRDEPAARVLAGAEPVVYGLGADGGSIFAIDARSGERLFGVDLPEVRAVGGAGLAATGAWRLAVGPSRVVGLSKEGVAFVVGAADEA